MFSADAYETAIVRGRYQKVFRRGSALAARLAA